jgi:peptide deformylase
LRLKIVQAGEPVLRQTARALTREEIACDEIQRLIQDMKETMQDAPGVGLAAPQVGVPLQLAVIEDREELLKGLPPQEVEDKERRPVPFHVIINPVITFMIPLISMKAASAWLVSPQSFRVPEPSK